MKGGITLAIEDKELLQRIINIQSCIIQGRSLKALLRMNMNYFLEESGADIINIYMNEHEKIKLEYILEKDKNLSHLLKKYVFGKKNFKWDKFLFSLEQRFQKISQYDTIKHPYEIFKGFLTKKETQAFNNELNLNCTVIIPIYNFDKKTKLGYICFLFQNKNKPDYEKINVIKKALQTLLQPLYNKKDNIMYSKCVRIDENMEMLTPQEKKIVKIVLQGISYPEAAKLLNISINTLKTHMKNIFNKCNVNSKIELSNKFHMYP
jgi:DNA-binding CsgD family transcriptional regulator